MFANVRRLVGRALAALLLAGGSLVLGSVSAQAAECQPQTTQEHAKSATAIFTGVVTGATKESKPGGQRGAIFTHQVEVDLVYKGTVTTSTVQVRTERTRDTCSLGELAGNTTYVFFTRADGDAWFAAGASGTAPASDKLLAKVERLLGAGHPPVPPAPETATFTAVSNGEPTTLTRAAAPGLALIMIGLLGLVVAGRLGSRKG